MDSDLAQKLQSVLSDPEALAKITSIANGLSAGGGNIAPQAENAGGDAGGEKSGLPAGAANAQRDPRVALLYSLKPLLRAERQSRIDDLARAMAMISLIGGMRKRGD